MNSWLCSQCPGFPGCLFKGLRSWSSEKRSGSLLHLWPRPGSPWSPSHSSSAEHIQRQRSPALLPPSQGPHGPQTEDKSRSWPALQDSTAQPCLPSSNPVLVSPQARSQSLGHSGTPSWPRPLHALSPSSGILLAQLTPCPSMVWSAQGWVGWIEEEHLLGFLWKLQTQHGQNRDREQCC